MVKVWKSRPIGELLDFKNGLNKGKQYFGHGTPIINYTDVYHKRGLLAEDVRGTVELSDSELRRYAVRRGDVFFTRTSETPEEVGISSVLLEDIRDCAFSGFVLRGRPKTNDLLPEYCKFCFSTKEVRDAIISGCTYTTRALTNGKLLSSIDLPIPDKTEQREIAAALSDVDELILNLEKLIEKKTAIKHGVMQQLIKGKRRLPGFHDKWNRVSLGSVCRIKSQLVDPRLPEYGRLPHIGNESIDKHTGHLLHYRTVQEDGLISGKYYFTEDDVLYGKINPQFGKVAFPRFSGLCSADMYPISCGDELLPAFLKYVLLSYDFLNYSISLSMRSGMPKVNRKELYGYEWDLPEIDEQIAIAEMLDDLDKEIVTLTNELEKYRDIKKGMMNELLTGRTRLI